MLNGDPNETKICNFKTCIEEFTPAFRELFVEYIFT